MGRPTVAKTPFAERLTSVRLDLGIKDRKAFAKNLGMNPETLGGYERGDSMPDHAFLTRYKQDFAVNLDWLITGEGEPFLTTSADAEVPSNGSSELDQRNFVRLPVFSEVVASAGYGAIPTSDRANNVIAFDRDFLRDQGGNPEKCSIIFARGTSMKPTIPDGAILVVDHSQRDVAHGCIYVFNVGEQLLVKRARWRLDGRLELVSDNVDEGYPVETFGPDAVDNLRVVGRVVYFGRTP